MKATVLMHEQFDASYDKLDGSIKDRVLNFMVRLQREPNARGLDLKHPKGAQSYVRTARVNDFYRAVLITAGSAADKQFLSLLAVKKHDDAYEFASSVRAQVNEKTGAIEIVDDEALRRVIGEANAADEKQTPGARPFLPPTIRQKDLERFGVATEVAERLTTVVDEDMFVRIIEALPATQGAAVLDMAYGKSPDEAWKDYGGDDTEPIDVEDFEAALQRPVSRLNFTAATADNEDELRAVLEGDLAAWRVWLHPTQRKLAYHDGWNGPFRVTGGAGTGKTVTAIHRARHLADRLDEQAVDGRVLLTTFTRNLVRAIEAQLVDLAGSGVAKRVDVQNVDSVARAVLAATDSGRGLLKSSKLIEDTHPQAIELWRGAKQVSTEDWDPEFLADEWSLVVLGNAIEDRAGYLKVPRAGRSQRLSRPQRADIWSAIEQFQRLIRVDGLMTYTELAARAATLLGADSGLREQFGYRHAIIDEAQDLHPAHWKMLRALVLPSTDDLFIVGDAHQRIYGRPTPLSRYGIETRGRSRRLTINYRTSREILKWTLKVADPDVDDLDVEKETLEGSRSVFSGPEPESHEYESTVAENEGIAEIIKRWQSDGLRLADIGVFAYERRQVDDIADALNSAGVECAVVGSNTKEGKLGDVVRVMTMHRAKGLEYRGVILARVGKDEFPPAFVRRAKGERRERELKRLRSVLYVAGSRARERMAMLGVGGYDDHL